MIDYIYRAKDQETGEIVKANVSAESPQAAAKLLMQKNLFPLEITPVDGRSAVAILERITGHISAKDRILFTRQLSTLINAGLPLVRALHTVQDQVANKALKQVIAEVTIAVEGGSSLSDALAQKPKVFNDIYVSLVAAGETSGTLDKALTRLADQQEKDAAIMSKIRSAMIYPAIVVVLIIAVVAFMLVSVVPQVSSLYDDLGKDLPFMTQILVTLSNFLVHSWWLALIILGVIGAFLRSVLATEAAKYQVDKLKLHMPVFGVLFNKLYMARFSRTMHTLLASGIPMLQALETTRKGVGNRLVAADIEQAIIKVRGGKALSDALEVSPSFIPLVGQMTKIGEESGAIDTMLDRVAGYYEAEVDEAVNNLSATLEPIMMVVLGGIVAAILLAVLGPVYSLIGGGDLDNLN